MTSIDKHFHWRLSHDLQKNQLRSTVDVTALLRPLPRHLPMVLFDAQVSPSPDNSDNTLEHIGTHHGQLCQSTSFSHLFTVRRSVCHTRHTLLDFSRIVGSCHFWRQHCPFEVWVSAELRTNRAKSSLLSGPPQIEPELNRDWEMKWDEQRRFPPLNSRTCAIVCYCMGMDKIHSSSRRNPTIHNFHYFPGTCGMQLSESSFPFSFSIFQRLYSVCSKVESSWQASNVPSWRFMHARMACRAVPLQWWKWSLGPSV